MIPCVERLKERANNAGQQDKCDGYSRRAGSHGFEYSVSGSHGKRQNEMDINRRGFMVSEIGGSDGTHLRDGQACPSRRLVRMPLQILMVVGYRGLVHSKEQLIAEA